MNTKVADRMNEIIKMAIKWNVILIGSALVLFWCVWAYLSWRTLPLSLWHRIVPDEMSASEIDAADWAEYLATESLLFDEVERRITARLPLSAQVPSNRYFPGSPLHPGSFTENWNRSYILAPSGPPVGAAVFLHGLTDSPYSLRHLASAYRDRGYFAICIRLPGHGTLPAALTRIRWKTWMSAVKLAIREAGARVEPDMPLHIVGYSNGATLAMKYALESLEDANLRTPDRLIFLSPMIGVTRYARFAGIAALPSLLPPFAKTAWQSILPEYNPFKYNSFAINAATQSYHLTKRLQSDIQKLSANGRLMEIPPILTFQSLVDHTVSTAAVFYHLYEYLPENGSEMVLFDINRTADISPLMNVQPDLVPIAIAPALPLSYRFTVVTNISADGVLQPEACAATYTPNSVTPTHRPLGISYPPDIFSLSHVAIPFPIDDELYGIAPPEASAPRFGINLGTLNARGERGMLIVNMDVLYRTTSNPFFPYLLERVHAGINDPKPPRAVRPHTRREPDRGLMDAEQERLKDLADDEEKNSAYSE